MKKKYKIFVLEDSAVQREQIAEVLKQNDRNIIFADSIRKAKKIYNNNGSDIDLFILDLKLPNGNGIDFLKYVRQSSNFSPAIIESSVINSNIKNKVGELGIIAFFEKPIQPDEFKQTVSTILPEKNLNKKQATKRN